MLSNFYDRIGLIGRYMLYPSYQKLIFLENRAEHPYSIFDVKLVYYLKV